MSDQGTRRQFLLGAVSVSMVSLAGCSNVSQLGTQESTTTTADSTPQKNETKEAQTAVPVSNVVQITSSTGEVRASEVIYEVNLVVRKSPDSGQIDLSKTTIAWMGSEVTVLSGAINTTPDGSTFNIYQINADKGNPPTLEESGDRLGIQIAVSSIEDGGLAPGDTVDLTITTQAGGTTTDTLTVPESLGEKETVQL